MSEEYELHDGVAEDIAIVGMAGRFPGANDVLQYWNNLRDGVESITFLSDEELRVSGVPEQVLNDPAYVKAAARLDDVELFDAEFFGYSPAEAEYIDPQQRLFLEFGWNALENSGYSPDAFDGAIGVYAGVGLNRYLLFNLLGQNEPERIFAVEKDFLSTRLSYKLNLTGPSLVIQTACSTSLVAIAEACQSLLDYRCDMALTGGVGISLPLNVGYYYQEEGIASPDGHCRAFDANAQGTVFGSGGAVVVLRRLSEALEAGDSILAVIKGFAINNDGSGKVGYTAPSVDGQARVIALAQALAGVDADTISYIEAHGTGTPLGDPIEVAALTKAFQITTNRTGFCALGSVKTNVGHLDTAAGVAGLVKTVLALQHRQLPPSLNFETPNPKIAFDSSPFYVNSELQEWHPSMDGIPRRAGISSFGIGGTNAHVIVEEAPSVDELAKAPAGPQLLLLSARSATVLESMSERLAENLRAHPEQPLTDVAYTLQAGRKTFEHRCMLVCRDREDALRMLEKHDLQRLLSGAGELRDRSCVYMFSGQGSQYPGMAQGLYQGHEVFRLALDECCELLGQELDLDLRRLLYPETGQLEAAEKSLNQTQYAQPALFAIEYALARLWMSWGIEPQAMIGHSIGEYVAACIAGVFSLSDALRLVAARGKAMQAQPGGSMLSVPLSRAELELLLLPELCVAVVNSSSMCVVSGPTEAVDAFAEQLSAAGHTARQLHTSHAFHSAMMEPAMAELKAMMAGLELSAPQIPVISNLTGTWLTDEQAVDPDYWALHLRSTVLFTDGVETLLQDPGRWYLEVGPGNTLVNLVRQHAGCERDCPVLPSVRHPRQQEDDVEFILGTLGRVWLAGMRVDWNAFQCGQHRRRVPLPTYPFERQRYWVDPVKAETPWASATAPVRISDVDQWMYGPVWKSSLAANQTVQAAGEDAGNRWLIFMDCHGMGDRLAHRINSQGGEIMLVREGDKFEALNGEEFLLNPGQIADYQALFTALEATDKLPDQIIHLWSLSDDASVSMQSGLLYGFYSLLYIAQSLNHLASVPKTHIQVVANGILAVTGEEKLCPEKSPLLGVSKVITQELPAVTCTYVDVEFPQPDSSGDDDLADLLVKEFHVSSRDTLVAYRHRQRWVQEFERIDVAAESTPPARLRQSGVYLITGGLGGLGLVFAEYLATTVGARMVLIGRRRFPDREEWDQWLTGHEDSDETSRRIRRLQGLEGMGAELLISSADVADARQMKAVIEQAEQRFGALHGVIHAAGVVGGPSFSLLDKLQPEHCELQFSTKIRGLQVLRQILAGRELDFVMPVSSLAAVLGGLGMAAYAAANQFMDSLVQQQHQAGDGSWLTVNWDAWQLQEENDSPVAGGLAAFALNPAEGAEAFDRILRLTGLSQVVVSTGDLGARLRQWLNPKAEQEETPEAEKPRHARPSLANVCVAAETETQKAIVLIWQALFSIDELGIQDNFFELGGHSLLAIQAVAKLREELGVELSLDKFLELGSVEALAEHVETIRWAAQGNAALADDVECDEFEL